MATPNQDPHEKESFKDKFKTSLKDFQSNEKMGHLMSDATANTRDTICYVALIIGVVLMFFSPLYGGALIGLIFGFYFSSEILALGNNVNELVEHEGIVKSLIAGGLLLGLFVSAPAIFIGMALAVAIRQVLFQDARKPK